MTTLQTIRLNPEAPVERVPLAGDDFCVVIDDFLENPESLIEYASHHASRFRVQTRSYPGVMMGIDPAALSDFERFVRNRMSRAFGFLRGDVRLATGLSMVTFQPDELSSYQRICHTDPRLDLRRRNYAALVYLFDDETLGGTAFYRYRRPEVIARALELDATDPDAAAAFLAEHSSVFREPPRYLTESNDLAERLCVVPPRFNRMIFYSGEIAHSAHITEPARLSSDPRRGRLTLNCFASVKPQQSVSVPD